MSLSRSARDYKLEMSEVEVLIAWHRDEQFRLADREEYSDARDHKDRAETLRQQLDELRAELKAETVR